MLYLCKRKIMNRDVMIIKVPKELTKEQALIIKEEFQNEYKNRFVMVFATEKDNNIAIEVTKINR